MQRPRRHEPSAVVKQAAPSSRGLAATFRRARQRVAGARSWLAPLRHMTSPGKPKEVAVRPLPLRPLATASRCNTRKPGCLCQESCGLYLHMELVQMLLGSEPNPSTAQLQHAGRKLEAVGFQVGERLGGRDQTLQRPDRRGLLRELPSQPI